MHLMIHAIMPTMTTTTMMATAHSGKEELSPLPSSPPLSPLLLVLVPLALALLSTAKSALPALRRGLMKLAEMYR